MEALPKQPNHTDGCSNVEHRLSAGVPGAPTPMKGLLSALALLALVALSGCQARPPATFSLVELGMTQNQVRDVLGQPSNTISAPALTPGDAAMPWTTRWQWGDTLSTSATSALFPDQPPSSRLGAVWFNDAGHVVAVQIPDPSTPTRPVDRWAQPPR